jgi:hypothetical protein
MHSNFITPPDYVESVLILNATQEQIRSLVPIIKSIDTPYNVYFYNDEMNAPEWLAKVKGTSSVTLDANLTNPEEFFAK